MSCDVANLFWQRSLAFDVAETKVVVLNQKKRSTTPKNNDNFLTLIQKVFLALTICLLYVTKKTFRELG